MFVRIEIESFFEGKDISETLTCAKFEELNLDLFKETMKPVEQVLKDANVKIPRSTISCSWADPLVSRFGNRSVWPTFPGPIRPGFHAFSRWRFQREVSHLGFGQRSV